MTNLNVMKMLLLFLISIFDMYSADPVVSPGVLKREETTEATFLWNLSKPFDVSVNFALMRIYKGNQTEQVILLYTEHGCNRVTGDPNLSCVDERDRVGFNITSITTNNASIYCIELLYGPADVPDIKDCNALLYVYQLPTNPVISGNKPVTENTYLTLSCHSDSQSLPPEYNYLSEMEYFWSWIMNGTGSNITIGPLDRKHNASMVTCVAKEHGTSDRLKAENSVTLDVRYPPSHSLLSSNSTTAIEAMEGVNLTCVVPIGDEGNPDVYSYYWKAPSATSWMHSVESSLLLESNSVNATRHDGKWECKIGNEIGNSTTAQLGISVNALPSVQGHPQDTVVLVNETLTTSCSFNAKPPANITWIYEQSGRPDTTVLNITTSETNNEPYAITTSVLSWKTTNHDQRKLISGHYTCIAKNIVGCTLTDNGTIDVQYWPLSISFISPGDTSDIADVIENTTLVNRTCSADCNPDCSYIWINDSNGLILSYTALLDLDKPDRYDAGTYTCVAHNRYGERKKTLTVNVRFPPSLSVTTSNISDIVKNDNVSLRCHVASNPVSDIHLFNMTDNTSMANWDKVNIAEYQFADVHCLDTGEYLFVADNDIPDEKYVAKYSTYMDIGCSPSNVYQIPESGIEGVPLGENQTFEIGIISNPYPTITAENWQFVDYNGTAHNNLPENVNTLVQDGKERLTIIAKLTIIDTKPMNYGNYSLITSNKYGNMTPITLGLVPEGPPLSPSAPRLMDITAVSIKINWTAGFNGGLEQRFTVLYKVEASETEHEAKVDTELGITKGDIVVHKLKDNATIMSNTTYIIRIQAENNFEGGSMICGKPAAFRTLVKAVFSKDPEITINEGRAHIHFVISGPLTHILEENCVKDTTICDTSNITVPTKRYLKTISINIDTHNFSADVPLADSEATQFVFSFWMYDGEDLLQSNAYNVPVDITGGNIGVIVGVMVGVLLAAAVVTTFIILWKRGILPKKQTRKASASDATDDNPEMSPTRNTFHEDQLEVGPINGDTYALVTKTWITRPGNQTETAAPQRDAEVRYVYENLAMPEISQGHRTGKQRQRSFSLIGNDGTVYADLEVIGKPSETGIIHGIEKKVVYDDIGIINKVNIN